MAKHIFRVNENLRGIFDDGQEFPPLPQIGSPKRNRRKTMATYRVILQVDCDEECVIDQLGEEYLQGIKQDAEDGDYLKAYIEHELGWAEQSFDSIQIEEIELLVPPAASTDEADDSEDE